MKKLIFLFAVLFIGYGSFAQQQKTNHKEHQTKDCFMMENGQMVMMKNGQTMPMHADTTLSNGTTVMMDGTLKMKDGKTRQLKADECVYMDGKVGHMKTKSENKSGGQKSKSGM